MANAKKYALLVGIDKYLGKVKPLKGPLRDVEAMNDYLAPLGFNINQLKGPQATREAIISQFKSHLIDHAEAGALLLFYFSGHGSQEEKAHKDILQYQGNRFNETLICYDSRTDGQWDLSDKELKWLIKQAAAKKAEVVVIVDACHSGSVTRIGGKKVFRAKQGSASGAVRPLDSYIADSASYSEVPRHILLAACKKEQLAMEFEQIVEGDYIHKGLFTDSLLSILKSTGSAPISYRRLMAKSSLLVKRDYECQTPHLDVFGFFDTYKNFLDLSPSGGAGFKYPASKKDGECFIEFGINRGMPFDAEKTARFAIYEDESLKKRLSYAAVTSVELNRSIVEPEKPIADGQYVAVPLELPTQKLSVYTNHPKEALQKQIKGLEEHAAFRFNDLVEWEYLDKDLAECCLLVEAKGRYSLRYADTNELIYPKYDHSPRNLNNRRHLEDLLKVLQLIENWRRFSQISKPIRFSIFHEDKSFPFEFSVCDRDGKKRRTFSQSEVSETTEITLDHPGQWGYCHKQHGEIIRYQINAKNELYRNLSLCLLYFSRDFEIESDNKENIEARNAPIILKKGGLNLAKGLNQETEVFKLFASENLFENFFPDQRDLKSFEKDLRGIKARPNKPLSDWFTQTLHVKVLRELGEIGQEDLAIADAKILFKKHASFSAKASLISTARSARSHAIDYYISELAQGMEGELIDFSADNKRETLLEIHHIDDKAVVNKTQPLEIIFDIIIKPEERLTAFTIPANLSHDDGEQHFLLPVGTIQQTSDGKFSLTMDHIPDNPPDGRFETGKSLKISLLKMT